MTPKSSLLVGNRRPQRVPGGSGAGRWLRRVGVAFVILIIGVPLAYFVFLRATRIVPPPIAPEVASAAAQPVTIKGQRAYLGPNWMSREHGVWEEHLEGEPYAMGYAQARLGMRLLLEQED